MAPNAPHGGGAHHDADDVEEHPGREIDSAGYAFAELAHAGDGKTRKNEISRT
jgi:hypothetical protein